MKHLVCYSGGHSSALVAIEVVRRFGAENTILLNHDIHSSVEHEDIKRFKAAVAHYLQLPITYANHPEVDHKDQFDVVMDAKAFKVGTGTALCTHRLKTQPFEKYLKEHFPVVAADGICRDCTIYYGFDKNETARIQRRSSILGQQGYKTDFPLALWKRTIQSTREIHIEPPMTYAHFKHANCVGCLKAGKQHWYIVYCTRPDIWEKAKTAEDVIGYSVIKGIYLEELEPKFKLMREMGVIPTEHVHSNTFWAAVARLLETDTSSDSVEDAKPCECVI